MLPNDFITLTDEYICHGDWKEKAFTQKQMEANEDNDFILGDKVVKLSNEYICRGEVVGVIVKKSKAVRIVVENSDGRLFILRPDQLEIF